MSDALPPTPGARMKKQSKQHDELQTSRADMKKAAERYAERQYSGHTIEPDAKAYARLDFLAGVRWERRRRKREGC